MAAPVADPTLLPGARGELDRALDEVASELGEVVELDEPNPGHVGLVALTASAAVYLAYDPPSRARLRQEASCLRWAAAAGVTVPGVLLERPAWMATERLPNDPPAGAGFVEAVVANVRRVAAAPSPAHLLEGARNRASRRNLVVSAARIARSPLGLRAFLEARRAGRNLPADALSHGDFYLNNLLHDAGRGRVGVIDWETLGLAAQDFDLLMLWPQLEAEADRAALLEAALAAPGADRERVGRLHWWLAVRYVAVLVDEEPPSRWGGERMERALRLAREARANCSRWTR